MLLESQRSILLVVDVQERLAPAIAGAEALVERISTLLRAAAELDVPIVPIKLDGLWELKQRRQFFVRPGTVSVTFGEPVQFRAGEKPEEITRELETRVRNL